MNVINRRKLLKMLGFAGLTTLTMPLTGKLIGLKETVAQATQVTTETSGKKRKWAMVIDLKKCDGCDLCTVACSKAHFVPENQKWIEVYKEKSHGGGTYPLPAPCMQCENAPCAKVCPVKATYYNDEGVVLINHKKCIGCRLCMAACPYHRRFFNWSHPEVPPEAHFAEYSPEYPVPPVRGTVIKCMFCAHHANMGKLPECVKGCLMGAIYFGDKEEGLVTNGVELLELDHMLAENNAYRFNEELGTKPRVYYLPGHGQKMGRPAL
jgi:molybdopterin-containing oxidoreductase family iron-sulfur binding subunit